MVAITTSIRCTFPRFSTLPRELRDQIWCDALPDVVGLNLYFYKEGCWCPRRLTEDDEEYDFEFPIKYNLNLEFRHDFLDVTEVEIPLAFVNHEAREIALAWIRDSGLEIRLRVADQTPAFVRSLDPECDVLYVPLDSWDEFLSERVDRQYKPDLFEQIVDIKTSITRIAVPEALFRCENPGLAETFEHFSHLETLFVIIDPQLDLQPADTDTKLQPWWVLLSTNGETYSWNNDHARFEFEGDENNVDEASRKAIEDLNSGFYLRFITGEKRRLKICPVSAVRK